MRNQRTPFPPFLPAYSKLLASIWQELAYTNALLIFWLPHEGQVTNHLILGANVPYIHETHKTIENKRLITSSSPSDISSEVSGKNVHLQVFPRKGSIFLRSYAWGVKAFNFITYLRAIHYPPQTLRKQVDTCLNFSFQPLRPYNQVTNIFIEGVCTTKSLIFWQFSKIKSWITWLHKDSIGL